MFGGSSSPQQQHNPALADIPKPAFTPTRADSSILLSGLMGLRPRNNPALSNLFNFGRSPALGRRPSLMKRSALGGA